MRNRDNTVTRNPVPVLGLRVSFHPVLGYGLQYSHDFSRVVTHHECWYSMRHMMLTQVLESTPRHCSGKKKLVPKVRVTRIDPGGRWISETSRYQPLTMYRKKFSKFPIPDKVVNFLPWQAIRNAGSYGDLVTTARKEGRRQGMQSDSRQRAGSVVRAWQCSECRNT